MGPVARREMGPSRDVELLVIESGTLHRGRMTEEIYMGLFGVGQAIDVIVVTPDDAGRYRESFAAVIHAALKEGRVACGA